MGEQQQEQWDEEAVRDHLRAAMNHGAAVVVAIPYPAERGGPVAAILIGGEDVPKVAAAQVLASVAHSIAVKAQAEQN